MSSYKLDGFAADNLVGYLGDQRAQTGAMPTDRAITIERFRDELGDVRVCILSPFGSRIHAPWALVLAKRLEADLGYRSIRCTPTTASRCDSPTATFCRPTTS